MHGNYVNSIFFKSNWAKHSSDVGEQSFVSTTFTVGLVCRRHVVLLQDSHYSRLEKCASRIICQFVTVV